MNALDCLIWTLAAWLLALIVNRGERPGPENNQMFSVPQLWILVGLVLGVGLENKISILFFGFGLVIGLLLTSQRRHLRTRWPWCAGGAMAVGQMLAGARRGRLRAVVVIVFVVSGAAMAPMTLPILPVETFIKYQQQMMGGTLASCEQKEVGVLPQQYSDMFGNEELVAMVAEVYHGLTPEEKSQCMIFGIAYPQAGAVDFFGPRYDLPRAVSGHNSYWLWGPGDRTGEIMISLGLDEKMLGEMFEEVTLARVFYHPYAMPWRNNLSIFICRKPYQPLQELWPKLKHYE